MSEEKKGIIELLGINQLSSKSTHKDGYAFFDYREVRELEKQRDEMLEALIHAYDFIEDCGAQAGVSYILDEIIEKSIQKATNKSWPEIKTLLEQSR